MAGKVARGEIWQYRFGPPDKPRPVLIVSRQSLLDVLHTATVVAITSTVRGVPTEVALGVDQGLKGPSCVNLANLFTVRQNDLKGYVGAATPTQMQAICRALVIAAGCD